MSSGPLCHTNQIKLHQTRNAHKVNSFAEVLVLTLEWDKLMWSCWLAVHAHVTVWRHEHLTGQLVGFAQASKWGKVIANTNGSCNQVNSDLSQVHRLCAQQGSSCSRRGWGGVYRHQLHLQPFGLEEAC